MDEPALILNRHWSPIATTSARQALVMLCRESARVICPESYQLFDLPAWLLRTAERLEALARERVVRTPSCWIEKPEVILLSAYGGVPRSRVAFSRKNLFRRDERCCQYCGRRPPTGQLSIDHVLPRSRGGATTWENCVLACKRCNTRKANRTPRECGLNLARTPLAPTWSPLVEVQPETQPESWELFVRKKG